NASNDRKKFSAQRFQGQRRQQWRSESAITPAPLPSRDDVSPPAQFTSALFSLPRLPNLLRMIPNQFSGPARLRVSAKVG
ncbi:hypothetical protein LB504_011552, partial [Fusarium proliferatum]